MTASEFVEWGMGAIFWSVAAWIAAWVIWVLQHAWTDFYSYFIRYDDEDRTDG